MRAHFKGKNEIKRETYLSGHHNDQYSRDDRAKDLVAIQVDAFRADSIFEGSIGNEEENK